MSRVRTIIIFGAVIFCVAVHESSAARIGEIVETDPWDQMRRFITLSDRGLRLSLIGALLFGAVCGLLGSFIVVRKMALFGDAISHAVLPGVALGFLWSMSKDPVAILIGATLAGLAGSLLVGAIIRTTRIKQDAALIIAPTKSDPANPAKVAPISIATGSLLILHKNPKATPGRTACEIASPKRAILRTTIKLPNNPQTAPKSSAPIKLRRRPRSESVMNLLI
jgi:hypothetical protein